MNRILSFLKRGGIWLPLYFLLFPVLRPAAFAAVPAGDLSVCAVQAAERRNLAAHPTWRSLLHSQFGRCNIQDRNFLLSKAGCSLQAELAETLRAFFRSDISGDLHPICRFPARYYFLQRELRAEGVELPVRKCVAFDEYLARAPAERISLILASENVTQPTSMMGHVFLKLDGRNAHGLEVSHAVSYFTRIDSLNIPKLVLESLFLGMPSFFALVPYSEQVDQYLTKEDRNVWEYSLALSDDQRSLIHRHVWELKEVNSEYLFAGYNCATVVYFILSIAAPEFLDVFRLWVSPLDVAKQAHRERLIAATTLVPSSRWRIRMLKTELDREGGSEVRRAVELGDPSALKLGERDEAAFPAGPAETARLRYRTAARSFARAAWRGTWPGRHDAAAYRRLSGLRGRA